MSTVVIRDKNRNAKGLFHLSNEAHQRTREHLKSAGIRVEDLQPLIWPDDAVSACKEHMYVPWKFTTKADIRQQKIISMNQNLWFKREQGVVRRRALYVWVFYVPSFFFSGWWTYLVGIGHDWYRGGGYKGNVAGELADDLFRLFPLEQASLFGPPNTEEWMEKFAKRYQRGRRGGKPQGKAPVWVEVKGNCVKRILGRAEWPSERRRAGGYRRPPTVSSS